MHQLGNAIGFRRHALQFLESPDHTRLAGVQAELILGAIERKARSAQPSNSSYLEQRVQYLREDNQLVDEESQGVMMAWEGPLMQAHAKVCFFIQHLSCSAPYHI